MLTLRLVWSVLTALANVFQVVTVPFILIGVAKRVFLWLRRPKRGGTKTRRKGTAKKKNKKR
jgi:hypothetical protein